MIWQKLLKVGDSYVVTIPKEEVERLNLVEGQLLTIEIHPSEIDSAKSTDVDMAFEESWQRNEPGYRYLAEH
jgi:antitoxin component of MazEF toxin-antitoxin module